MKPLLILRPQPGADATARRAQELGLTPLVCPLFKVEPLDWSPPDPAQFDAIMLTSANAVRHGGAKPRAYTHLPCFVVGGATANAARGAGFTDIRIGTADIAALIAQIMQTQARAILHLGGKDVRYADPASLQIERIAVYESRETRDVSSLAPLLRQNPVILLHSPRAARRIAELVPLSERASLSAVAISTAAGDAAGAGWAACISASKPTDAAMLAIALQMCQ